MYLAAGLAITASVLGLGCRDAVVAERQAYLLETGMGCGASFLLREHTYGEPPVSPLESIKQRS